MAYDRAADQPAPFHPPDGEGVHTPPREQADSLGFSPAPPVDSDPLGFAQAPPAGAVHPLDLAAAQTPDQRRLPGAVHPLDLAAAQAPPWTGSFVAEEGAPVVTPAPVAEHDPAPPYDADRLQPTPMPVPEPPQQMQTPAPACGHEASLEPAADTASPIGHVVERPPLTVDADGRTTIDDLLVYITRIKASDLHAKAGSPPTVRDSGMLEPLDYPVLSGEECRQMALALMTDRELEILDRKGEVDFAYSIPGEGRYRVNVHRQRGTLAIAARRIVPGAPDLKQLNLPSAVEQLANEHRGLLLVTGPTSSGKTTTCGAIIKHINQTRRCHIVTIEDPIEILHEDEQSVVTQREVGQDTMDFHAALRAAMRQDPDVIFVGEIRDTETVSAALQAAETGHFVIATLHTTNVAETVNRIIDFFPPEQQTQTRVALAGSLVGVITQRLLPRVGGGRAPAIEVMISNGRIRDCILDPEKSHGIHEIVAQSDFYGMQTFDQALVKLYRQGVVTLDDARAAANSAHDFELALQKAGLLDI